ncbi:hypothetical protein [Crenobacter cavernae]|uniref:hypothetical protein n=1 Tax=Crenobacter cavernae TaxID=2290923 RepID=UPI0011C01DE3|nr:hypothetical protein [Crenobacter cavernae]
MSKKQPTRSYAQKVNHAAASDLPKLMNKLFGEGQWFFDESEGLHIAKDPQHSGPGFGFVAVRLDGTWFKGVRPDGVLQ